MTVSLVGLLITILIAAVVLYAVQLLPLDAPVKRILQIVVGLIVLLWLLGAFGVLDYPAVRVR